MNTRKILLFVLMLAAFCDSAFAKLRVVATLDDFSSLAESVGGDKIEASALGKGYQDPHFLDAKPSFIVRLSRADLLIVAGSNQLNDYFGGPEPQRSHPSWNPWLSRCVDGLRHPPAPHGAGDPGDGGRSPLR